MAFSGRPYVNVGSKIGMQRCIFLSVVVCTENTSRRSYPSFTLPRHLRNAYTLVISSVMVFVSGASYNKGKAALVSYAAIRKSLSGIMSARRALPPERQCSGNHSSVRIRATRALLNTCPKPPWQNRTSLRLLSGEFGSGTPLQRGYILVRLHHLTHSSICNSLHCGLVTFFEV
jgi:hypothetical protein